MFWSKIYRLIAFTSLMLLLIVASFAQPIAAQTDVPACPTTLAATEASTPEATLNVTAEAMLEVTDEAADLTPIRLDSFLPTDIHFNPDVDNPFALVTVYSLVFQNQLDQALHIEKPQFQLTINDVPWGELASTDFRTGQLNPHATQGIVLQNLTIIAQTTPEQQAILTCLKTYQPVDLTLTGTLDAFPNGVKQSVPLTLTTPQVVLREHS